MNERRVKQEQTNITNITMYDLECVHVCQGLANIGDLQDALRQSFGRINSVVLMNVPAISALYQDRSSTSVGREYAVSRRVIMSDTDSDIDELDLPADSTSSL
jgi:hypothetical protein